MTDNTTRTTIPTGATEESTLSRRAAILGFLFRYRKSGVFNGLKVELFGITA